MLLSWGCSSTVEHRPCKAGASGSNPDDSISLFLKKFVRKNSINRFNISLLFISIYSFHIHIIYLCETDHKPAFVVGG